jgi:hypothetical protein
MLELPPTARFYELLMNGVATGCVNSELYGSSHRSGIVQQQHKCRQTLAPVKGARFRGIQRKFYCSSIAVSVAEITQFVIKHGTHDWWLGKNLEVVGRTVCQNRDFDWKKLQNFSLKPYCWILPENINDSVLVYDDLQGPHYFYAFHLC